MKDVCVIIPVYNEGKVIKEVLLDLLEYFPNVICVDDGSTDNSSNEIKKSKALLIRHVINLGAGGARQTGFEYALTFPNIKYFVTFDADGQHHPKDVIEMIGVIRSEGCDMVLGSRFLGETKDMPFLKGVLLKMGIWFTSVTSKVKLTDAHNGLRVLNRHATECMKLTMTDFSYASEIIDRISGNKLSYVEHPVTISYTDYSRSKGQSMTNAVNIAVDTVLKKASK